MRPDRGLLIVNADDWGHDEATTEAIAVCHEAGALTSTTAMMFMEGSEDAARRARDLPRLGIGLHLNLDEEYSGRTAPPAARDRQRRYVEYYRSARARRWLYDPRVRQETSRIITDQLRRFEALYGRPPTHVDGHHHAHQAANVLLSRALPRGTKIRRTRTDTAPRHPAARVARGFRDRLVARRYRMTRFFFDIRAIWPSLGGGSPERILDLSNTAGVEIMVHPGLADEYAALRSPQWPAALAGRPLGTYASL